MVWFTTPKQLALTVAVGAALALGTAQYVAAQDATEAESVASAESPAVFSAGAAALPDATTLASSGMVIPVTSEQPALDNPPLPGDAFPTMPYGNTE